MTASLKIPADLRSAGNVPFLFGACQARALPGPILTDLLVDLGSTRPAARTLLTRLVRMGSMSVSRSGRVGVYRLAGPMESGFRRISSGLAPAEWDGRFHTVVFDIAESHRGLKDRLRYTAMLSGFGQLRSGVLISVQDRHEELDALLRDDAGSGFIAYGELAFDLDTSRRVAARAWELPLRAGQLDAEAARLRRGLDEPVPDDGTALLRRFSEELRQPFRLMLTFPRLPAELLPAGWPGAELDAAIAALSEHLGPATATYLAAVIASSPHRGLVEYARRN